jgi:hypothetical protein
MPSDYTNIEHGIIDWGNRCSDIQGIFIIGSRGRSISPQSSADLDLIVVTTKLQKYSTNNLAWCNDVGPIVLGCYQAKNHMVFNQSTDYYVVFEPDMDVDFSFVQLRTLQKELFFAQLFLRFPGLFSQPIETSIRAKASAFYPGFRILLDRDHLQEKIKNTFGKIPWKVNLPTVYEFISAIDEFLIYAFKTIKKIQSGKLFHAKWMSDVTLRYQLVCMAEWHICSQSQQVETIRYRDLSVDEWADPRVKDELAKITSTFEVDSIQEAILTSVDLFYWMSAELAKNLRYDTVLIPAIDRFEYLKQYIHSMKTGI